MKKTVLISLVLVGVTGAVLVGFLTWYFTSPSASQSQLKAELNKLQPDTVEVVDQGYASGSCFDVCASASLVAKITSTSDYPSLYQQYSQQLRSNGYTVDTSEEEFAIPTRPNGNSNSYYLTIDAKGSNKYQLRIRFDSSATPINRNTKTQQPITSVDTAKYSLTASTR